ncbi:TPA: hypothetical protein ACS70L_003329 [Providencia alcalifaciens]|uniref:hypothetical protein n=1 Tax=Providencia sp. PROV104 TaxID=2949816 RepID=UPI001A31E2AC|nr:hypothetical protein [Providencia sp. PROV104]
MKRHQKIRCSRLFQVNAHGYVTTSFALTAILEDVKHYFPMVKRIIWSSYRADNEIHELVIEHNQGLFVLTMESGLGPTSFSRISQEDWDIQHKQVEFVDSVDIFHFIRCLVELHQLYKINIEDEKMIYSS